MSLGGGVYKYMPSKKDISHYRHFEEPKKEDLINTEQEYLLNGLNKINVRAKDITLTVVNSEVFRLVSTFLRVFNINISIESTNLDVVIKRMIADNSEIPEDLKRRFASKNAYRNERQCKDGFYEINIQRSSKGWLLKIIYRTYHK